MQSSPPRPVRAVLDTDTYNEVDDQFALAHLLLSPEKARLEAIHAAPFVTQRVSTPAEGMEKSHEEIHRVLDLVGPAVRPPVCRGSTAYLSAPDRPVESEAARDLIARALDVSKGPLTVIAIAVPTNVASALLMEPRIASRIEVIWLGGHAPYWHTAAEFNLGQDAHAARILFDHDVPLVHVPCRPVASHMLTTAAELGKELAPYSRLGAFLTEIVSSYEHIKPGWAKEIWDMAATAWLTNPEALEIDETPSPLLADDLTWRHPGGRRRIRTVRAVNRNTIFADFFAKARSLAL